jgi:hypothetical protein
MIPLVDKQLQDLLPKLYDQENIKEKYFYARFYHPVYNWEWYVMEYSSLQRLFFGLVDGVESEYGYFNQDELEQIGVVRDYDYKPTLIQGDNYGRIY